MGEFRRTRTSNRARAFWARARPGSARGWCCVLGLVVLLAALATGAAATGPKAPRLQSPAPDARVGSVPAFSWAPVRGAALYEFQLSADADFGSIVQGQGRGSFQTA